MTAPLPPDSPAPRADFVVRNARVITLDPARPAATAVGSRDGVIVAVGDEIDVMRSAAPDATVVDAGGRTLIPGLNDSHLHLVRGGLSFNMELRWDGVRSLGEALRMLTRQAQRTPPPQWVRVVGGWSEFQFAERRMPTLAEINRAAPDTPVFVLHLYQLAMLNAAALRAVGYTKDTPDPVGGEIQRDKHGNPTGLLIARPNAMVLYQTLALGPTLARDDQKNSSRQFMRELNRLGVTSVVDAGGGFQNYPDDYSVGQELALEGNATVRIAYNLFTQRAGHELEDFTHWVGATAPGQGNDHFHVNGAGEMLTFSAADFEDFPEPRPDLAPTLEADLAPVVRLLAEHRWPFRLHATYDESITRFLDVFEQVNREVPFTQNGTPLRWFFDHAETITQRNIDRVAALNGGIAVQDRMAFQGNYFADRYGAEAAAHSPPIGWMLGAGLPVGGGTDATRVASYNPWVSLHWMVSGEAIGGRALLAPEHRLDRLEALRRYTTGSAWFSGEEHKKGVLAPGYFADFAVLADDYLGVAEAAIKDITALLTVVGGRVVYADGPFAAHAPPTLPVSPDWSPLLLEPEPVNGAKISKAARGPAPARARCGHRHAHSHALGLGAHGPAWPFRCGCAAF